MNKNIKTTVLWLKLLIAEHGRQSVLTALAEIDRVEMEDLERELDELRMRKSRTKPRRKKTIVELLQDSKLEESKLGLIKQLGCAYESKWYLPEMWRVRRFLESRGVKANHLKSRADALPKVVYVLSNMSESELDKALLELQATERGDFALLADQIMGSSSSSTRPK